MLLGTFFTWTPENTSSTIGYMSDMISDFTPLLILVIAIALGLMVFTVIVQVIKK